MIDSDGYRPNVGIILANPQGKVLWARRVGQDAWQFPQGGIKEHESPEDALYRELNEEIGLKAADVEILTSSQGWLRYCLPKHLIRHDVEPLCIGQKQKWFLLKMMAKDDVISVDNSASPEFDQWRWVTYWHPLSQVVSFKRDVYRQAMTEFALTLTQQAKII